MTFRAELKDFAQFLRAPNFRRVPRAKPPVSTSAIAVDWWGCFRLAHVWKWAICLWVVNIFVLAPLAMAAMQSSGAEHRLDLTRIPWLLVVFWAPLVEELVFRYGLRRPTQILWLLPLAAWMMVSGPGQPLVMVCLALLLGLLLAPPAWLSARKPSHSSASAPVVHNWYWLIGLAPMPLAAGRIYRRYFSVVFWLSAVAFAALHLYNFNFASGSVGLMVALMLVLPQFCTGLVLAWLRIRRGMGSAVLLHAVFNGGPVLIVWVILQLVGEAALKAS